MEDEVRLAGQPDELVLAPAETGVRYVARNAACDRDRTTIVRPYIRRAMDQRSHPVASRDQPRADFAPDQPGRAGHEDVQQQPLVSPIASFRPKGDDIPHPWNTP